jgi:hypothetical protein
MVSETNNTYSGFCFISHAITQGTNTEELRVDIVRSLSSMFAVSDDSTNGDYSSSFGNIDMEWRRAMDDLRRQEAEEMMCGTYSKCLTTTIERHLKFQKL